MDGTSFDVIKTMYKRTLSVSPSPALVFNSISVTLLGASGTLGIKTKLKGTHTGNEKSVTVGYGNRTEN